MVATDIDCQAVRNLRKVSDGWRTGVCDFTNPRSRQSSPVLRSPKRTYQPSVAEPPVFMSRREKSICHSRRDHIKKVQPGTCICGELY